MTLLELIDLKRDEIALMGEVAIAEARRAGVPAVYMEPSLGPGLIREMPDGARERFERREGKIVVLERFASRTEHAE